MTIRRSENDPTSDNDDRLFVVPRRDHTDATRDNRAPVPSTSPAAPSAPASPPPPARKRPRLLFPSVFVLVCSAYASVLAVRLANTPVLSSDQLLPIGAYTVALLTVGVVLRLSRYRGDGPLVGAVMALCGMGIVAQFRIGTLRFGQEFGASDFAFPMGITAMLGTYLLFRRGRHRRLESTWLACMILSVLLVAMVLVLGRRYRGAVFLPGNVNPVDLVKPLLIIFLAAVLVDQRHHLRRRFLGVPIPPLNVVTTVALLWAPPMGMLLLQRDLGLITLLNGVLLVMLYSVTHRIGYLIGGGLIVTLLARFAVPLSSHAVKRFDAWNDPFTAATGSGWQILQGLVALYSGGLLGSGIGAGTPHVVPIVASDFVYVIFGEELGFVGCGLLLLLYIGLTVRGFGIAARVRSDFSSLVAIGITTCVALQTIINVGGVTKAIPLTGITLPFISLGGSSLITMLLMMGLLMAISEPENETTG